MKSIPLFILLSMLLATPSGSNAETPDELFQRLGDPVDWKTDAWEAYQLGVKKGLPVVLVLVTPLEYGVRHCNRMRSIVFSDDFQSLAGKAVFCLTSPDTDAGAKQLDDAFDLSGYPIVLVLEPDEQRLVQRGSILGCPADVAELRTHLDPLIEGKHPSGNPAR